MYPTYILSKCMLQCRVSLKPLTITLQPYFLPDNSTCGLFLGLADPFNSFVNWPNYSKRTQMLANITRYQLVWSRRETHTHTDFLLFHHSRQGTSCATSLTAVLRTNLSECSDRSNRDSPSQSTWCFWFGTRNTNPRDHDLLLKILHSRVGVRLRWPFQIPRFQGLQKRASESHMNNISFFC